MKFLLLPISFLFLTIVSFGQQTINGTLVHGGLTRTYILYVPASYSAASPAPLVFNFHGYTSSASAQMFYGDFRPIADTAGFILVAPQGTLDAQGNTYWNAAWLGAADDVGFTEALIDTISNIYNINQDRVYSTGMSNGGYMSYYLACNLSNRIAAIASVTGAMTNGTPLTCSPQHPTPVLEIHGDADGTVPYLGNFVGESIQDGLDYWVNYNNNNSTASFTVIPNINTSDNSTVEHYVYSGGDNCVDVEHYKILNGGHTWPSAPINTGNGETNRDINASKIVWEFFSKYDLNGKINCTVTAVLVEKESQFEVKIYPNPVTDFLNLKWSSGVVSSIRLVNIVGTVEIAISVNSINQTTISTKDLSKGIYFVEMINGNEVLYISKIVVD